MEYKMTKIEDDNKYQKYFDFYLKDIEAKFVARETTKTKEFVKLGKIFGFPFTVFGTHKDYTIGEEQSKIATLSNEKTMMPIKIVLTKDNRLFADNTHWAVSYLKRYGENVKLKEIPFLIIDFSFTEPKIVDYNGAVESQKKYINKIINSATDLNKRVENGWRPKGVTYTIGELKKELFKIVDKNIVFE